MFLIFVLSDETKIFLDIPPPFAVLGISTIYFPASDINAVSKVADEKAHGNTQESTLTLDKPLNQPLAFNATAWLDGVQESLAKAPLLN